MHDDHYLFSIRDGDTITPTCSCGWAGNDHTTEDAAVDDWENHCDVVFMEATQ